MTKEERQTILEGMIEDICMNGIQRGCDISTNYFVDHLLGGECGQKVLNVSQAEYLEVYIDAIREMDRRENG